MTTLTEAVRLLEQGDWESAHRIAQDEDSALGAWIHGVVHLMEGDEGNARYWYRRADRSPVDTTQIATEIALLKQHVGIAP